jgi:hypothetical protein
MTTGLPYILPIAGTLRSCASLPRDYNRGVKVRLSRRLSPRAKSALLQAAADERVHVLLSVSARTDVAALARRLQERGVDVSSVSTETHTIAASIAARSLDEVASLPEITYVEAAADYRR